MAFMKTFPKVGIRPIIDARKGARDSLENQAMDMAGSVAALISANLRYPDGSPVQCVVADTTIGRSPEASRCEEKFSRENVGLTITVTPCWCYGTEVLDLHPTRPKAIYGLNSSERPGAVLLAAAMAAYAQKGLPCYAIYGRNVKAADDKTMDADVAEKLLCFARAGLAAAIMNGGTYLSIGGACMGIAGSIVDERLFFDYLGMRNVYVDMIEVQRRIEKGIYDAEEYQKALAWMKAKCIENDDICNKGEFRHTRGQMDKEWEFTAKMAVIIKDFYDGNPKLAEMGYLEESLGYGAIVGGFQGQRQWTDFLPNADLPEAIFNSSFDWTGRREPYILATENDSCNGLSMLFGKLLTNTAQLFCDVRTYWSPEAAKSMFGKDMPADAKDGCIHLLNSGAAALDGTGRQRKDGKPVIKPFWEVTDGEVDDMLAHTRWTPAFHEYFRGGGFSSTFKTVGGMPATMYRLNMVKGAGPVLQIAEGYTTDLGSLHDDINPRTDPGWPTTYFVPTLTGEGAFTDVYSVMANWGANHCALSYGHIGPDLIALAALLRIPVSMHNVCRAKVFRPQCWSSFGTDSLEAADYRACAAYGPTHG